MKQLRGFKNSSNEGGAGQKNNIPQDMMSEAMKKYGGMDENALMNQLLNNVRTQKQNGTYDEAQLLSFVNNVSPHLTAAQRERLEGVLSTLSTENGK